MTQQFSISARDHEAGIPEQGFDDVAGGRRLPIVAIERGRPQDHLRDLLLGRAVAMAVDRLQHPPLPHALLAGQARIWRNGAAMELSLIHI